MSQTWDFRIQCLHYKPVSCHFCSEEGGGKSVSRGDHRVNVSTRDETGLVYLPTQLEYIATLLAMVNFTLMMECTPESSRCYSVYSVEVTVNNKEEALKTFVPIASKNSASAWRRGAGQHVLYCDVWWKHKMAHSFSRDAQLQTILSTVAAGITNLVFTRCDGNHLWRTISEAKFLDEIQTNSLKSFPPCYSKSPLCLEIFISSNSRNLLQFLQCVTVHCKG